MLLEVWQDPCAPSLNLDIPLPRPRGSQSLPLFQSHSQYIYAPMREHCCMRTTFFDLCTIALCGIIGITNTNNNNTGEKNMWKWAPKKMLAPFPLELLALSISIINILENITNIGITSIFEIYGRQ